MNEQLGFSQEAAEADIVVRLNRNGTVAIIKDRYGDLKAKIHRSPKGRFLVLSRKK